MTTAERILSARVVLELIEGPHSAPEIAELRHLEGAPTGADAEEPAANPFVELLGRFMPMMQGWDQAVSLALMDCAMATLWDDDDEEPKAKQTRRVFERPAYQESAWFRLYLIHPDVEKAGTRTFNNFRRAFRVPYPIFLELVALVRLHNWFPEKAMDVAGRVCCPLELKVRCIPMLEFSREAAGPRCAADPGVCLAILAN
jgi:hypothetical protein